MIEKQYYTVPSSKFLVEKGLKELADGEMGMGSFKRRNLALEGYYIWCSLRISLGVELVQHFNYRSCQKLKEFAHKIC